MQCKLLIVACQRVKPAFAWRRDPNNPNESNGPNQGETCNGAMEGLAELTLEQFLEAAPAAARNRVDPSTAVNCLIFIK